jgi:hypothetical protein
MVANGYAKRFAYLFRIKPPKKANALNLTARPLKLSTAFESS